MVEQTINTHVHHSKIQFKKKNEHDGYEQVKICKQTNAQNNSTQQKQKMTHTRLSHSKRTPSSSHQSRKLSEPRQRETQASLRKSSGLTMCTSLSVSICLMYIKSVIHLLINQPGMVIKYRGSPKRFQTEWK